MPRRVLLRVALLCVLGSCADSPSGVADGQARVRVTLLIDVRAADVRVGTTTQHFQLRVQPYYERTLAAPALIDTQRVLPLGTSAVQRRSVEFALDARACARDASRTPGGTGCPLRLDVQLFQSTDGLVLDHQKLGPWTVRGNALTVADTVRLHEVGLPDVVPHAPTIAVGESVQLTARFTTVAGETVSRPVIWRSEAPTIASVDTSGVVTGLLAGNAVVAAIFGNGQSSYGQTIVVRAR